MSDDKALLLKAAKAAGIAVEGDAEDFVVQPKHFAGGFCIINERGGSSLWNPLTDDGDAMRLAVKLNLTVRCYMGNTCAQATTPGGLSAYADETNSADPLAATRRAITRAAAKVGDGKDETP